MKDEDERESKKITSETEHESQSLQKRDRLPRRVPVIVNPAAGQQEPVLKDLNAAFKKGEIDWDINVTKDAGDGSRLARQAVEDGADLVAVYGGDGTVMEVASGLIGSPVPMAILPGGTANAMASELLIPDNLNEAIALLINPAAMFRKVDLGQIGERYFMLRAGMGFEAALVEGADRELKDRVGVLAYALSALQALSEPQITRYFLTLDGKKEETEGITCIIANSGAVGTPGMTLAPGISISDGLLDVIVVTKADLPSLVGVAASVIGAVSGARALQHWQAKEVTVRSEPGQKLQLDGEMIGETPVTARVVPGAVRVLVPPKET